MNDQPQPPQDPLARLSEINRGLTRATEPTMRMGQEISAMLQRQDAEQRSSVEQMLEGQSRARKDELDWRASLLEQQRRTVEALDALNTSQRSDRKLTWWLLGVATATLLAAIATVWITAAK